MTRSSSDLFNKRSATQEFLVSSSDDPAAGSGSAESCLQEGGPLSVSFPDMLDRQGLGKAADQDAKSKTPLCVIAVQFDGIAESDIPKEDRAPDPEITAEVLEAVVTICRQRGGQWARIGRCRFAFALPHLSGNAGRETANHMQHALAKNDAIALTAGVAVYPTANDSRSQTIQNAEKALDHAGFFGPGSITEFDAVSLNISGDRLYQAGDIRGAIEEFNKGLRLDPADTNLLNSLGVCYGVLKEYEAALSAFETAIWLAPEEMMPVYNQGYVFLRQGRTQRALQTFLSADAMEPGVFEVVFHIGQIYMQAGTPENARPYLETAVQTNNRSASAYRQLGSCLDRLGLTKEAIQAYKAVVKINPADAASLSLLGRRYAQRGESLDVASVLCEQSVQIAPDNGLFRHRLGCVYLEQGRLDVALAEFELAASLGHDSRAMIAEAQDRMIASKAS